MMMLLWLPLVLLIPFAIVWMLRSASGVGCCAPMHVQQHGTASPTGLEPMDIARQRLARGEITTAQFEEIRRAIS